jgi:hypothetical protein
MATATSIDGISLFARILQILTPFSTCFLRVPLVLVFRLLRRVPTRPATVLNCVCELIVCFVTQTTLIFIPLNYSFLKWDKQPRTPVNLSSCSTLLLTSRLLVSRHTSLPVGGKQPAGLGPQAGASCLFVSRGDESYMLERFDKYFCCHLQG